MRMLQTLLVQLTRLDRPIVQIMVFLFGCFGGMLSFLIASLVWALLRPLQDNAFAWLLVLAFTQECTRRALSKPSASTTCAMPLLFLKDRLFLAKSQYSSSKLTALLSITGRPAPIMAR